jgi:hypothetical protein
MVGWCHDDPAPQLWSVLRDGQMSTAALDHTMVPWLVAVASFHVAIEEAPAPVKQFREICVGEGGRLSLTSSTGVSHYLMISEHECAQNPRSLR